MSMDRSSFRGVAEGDVVEQAIDGQSAATSRMFRGALGPYRVTYQALLSSDDADRCNVLAPGTADEVVSS